MSAATGSSLRRLSRRDIPPVPSLSVSADAWNDPAQALATVRAWAEHRTAETIAWYLLDKRFKRWASRLLRAAAVILGVAGGIVPLIADGAPASVGYALLALAAGCVAFDHFFGLSAGWMRDMTAVQVLQRHLTQFELAWATWLASEAGLVKVARLHEDESVLDGDAVGNGVAHALTLVERLITEVISVTENETARWVSEFSTSMSNLRRQTGSPSGTGLHSPDGGYPESVGLRREDAIPAGTALRVRDPH